MTTPMIPDFIFKLYQEEVLKVVDQAIKAISEHHDIDVSKLKKTVEKHAGISFTIIPDDVEKIRILKLKPRKLPDDSERCISLVKTPEGVITRCKFRVEDGCDHHCCKRHGKKPSKYGVIEEAIADHKPNAVKEKKLIKRIQKIY